jgi:hypothetical protein
MTIGRWLTAILTISVLTASVGPAAAQPKVEDKGRPAGGERVPVDKASPMQMTGKVTQVDEKAKTFAVMSKGNAVTFGAAKLKALPKVGETVDITYTRTPSGALEAANLNLSKSNIN